MMPPHPAADDVSPLRSEMRQLAELGMMRCLPHVPQAHIIAAGSIMCKARIICPAGQTSFKKRLLSDRQKTFFAGGERGIRTLVTLR